MDWREGPYGQTLQEIIAINAGARHELTPLEAKAWLAAVATYSPEVVDRFLLDWISTQPAGKVLSIADLRAKLDPTFASPEVCLEQLRALTARVGPYDSLTADQASPVLARTIENLGGWARVNEVMPDPGDPEARFAWSAFVERFNGAFKSAASAVFQDEALPLENRPPLALPTGLHDASRAAAYLAAAMRARQAELATSGAAGELPAPGQGEDGVVLDRFEGDRC